MPFVSALCCKLQQQQQLAVALQLLLLTLVLLLPCRDRSARQRVSCTACLR